jgi:NADH-quinone oxidoreductase subunit M
MIAGGVGTILTAGYFLWMLQRINMGVVPEKWREHHLKDIIAVEWVSWLPLLALILVLGLFPKLVFGATDHAVNGLLQALGLS